jgi:very-short-patch-repair endonuclease
MARKRLTPVAQKLRREPTDAAIRLWSRIKRKQLGVQFTREFQIGNAIVDFACRRLKLAVEVDGSQHADNPADEARTRMIESYGYRVIRFWNSEVLQNTDGVVVRITEALALATNRTDWFTDDPIR